MTSCIKHSQSSSALLKLPASPISPLETKNQQLETFQFVWLDPHVHTDHENQATYSSLQQILTHVRTFHDCKTCIQWLQSYRAEEKIIFIVSGKFGKTIVPLIHDLKSIVVIYVFCLKPMRYEEWARKYPKVSGIVTFTNDLTQRVSNYQKDLESIEDSKAMQIFQDHQHSNDNHSENASFIWYHLFLEILISSFYLPLRDTFAQLTQILRQYCAGNNYHIASIEEFAITYEPKRAVAWLTRDTPVRRFINKALREQDIYILLLLRFFLKDIHFRLTAHSNRSLHVYKFQLMSLADIEYLQDNQDQYLFFPGFLCTSTDEPHSESVSIGNDQFQVVLLEIDAHPHADISPFAFIDEIDTVGKDRNDSNVLFMCGSIFQIGVLEQTHDSKWSLQLTLTGEKDLPLLTNTKRKLRQHGDLCMVGDLLEKHDRRDKAIVYYKCLLRELPVHHAFQNQIQGKLSQISKVKSISLKEVRFVLVDLSTRLNQVTSMMLEALNRLTNSSILIIDDDAEVALHKLDDKPLFLFTSSQFVASMKRKSEQNLFVFTLESNPSAVDQRTRFGTGEDLICQLADEMYRCYRKEASTHFQLGDMKMAKDKENLANRIHIELRNAYQKTSTKDQDNQSVVCTTTELVLLGSKNQDDNNIQQIRQDFTNIVTCCLYFDHRDECERYLHNDKNVGVVFLFVDMADGDSLVTDFERLNNVKRVYRYKSSSLDIKKDNETLNDLRYQLAYDLIAHYSDLGTDCRAKNDAEKAREMFSKAKKLCDFLAEFE